MFESFTVRKVILTIFLLVIKVSIFRIHVSSGCYIGGTIVVHILIYLQNEVKRLISQLHKFS